MHLRKNTKWVVSLHWLYLLPLRLMLLYKVWEKFIAWIDPVIFPWCCQQIYLDHTGTRKYWFILSNHSAKRKGRQWSGRSMSCPYTGENILLSCCQTKKQVLQKITVSGIVPSGFDYIPNPFMTDNKKTFFAFVSNINERSHCIYVQPESFTQLKHRLTEDLG